MSRDRELEEDTNTPICQYTADEKAACVIGKQPHSCCCFELHTGPHECRFCGLEF
jgi:hypothetical protein